MDWKQGEHITLIGPTGRGKTELTIALLEQVRWSVFFGTKRVDSTQSRLKRMGYRTIPNAAELNPEISRKFILRPPFPRRAGASTMRELHRRIFREGIMRAYHQTGWTLAVDEARYICDFLGLKEEMSLVWLQGRSQGNGIIAATQRPRHIPLEAYDQATHLFLWTDPDIANVRRIAEIAGFNYRVVADSFQEMSKHDVLYVNTVTEEMFITNTRWE
jgi:energy-coupling factor transporter ATP-binding protein EcfA2